jgi:hypothetical protein
MGHLHVFGRNRQWRNSSRQLIEDRQSRDRRSHWKGLRAFLSGPEVLENRTLLSFSSLATVLDGDLATVQGQLTSALDHATSIPFIGPVLGDQAPTQFIKGLRPALNSAISSLDNDHDGPGGGPSDIDIQGALFSALGSHVVDHDGNGLSPTDVVVTRNAGAYGASGFDVAVHLHAAALALPSLAFNTGLSGLPFKVDVATAGSLGATFGYDYELAFHYDSSGSGSIALDDGAKLSDISPGTTTMPRAPDHLLVVTLGANLTSDFSATATIGFIRGTLTPVPGQVNPLTGRANSLGATFSMDRLDDFSTALLTGQADASLQLGAGIGVIDAFPTVTTDFQLGWTLNSRDAADLPEVSFSDVKLDLGSFLSSVLGPIVQDLSQIVGPGTAVGDIIAAIQTHIPGLSDLSELLGDGPVTIENLAVIAAGNAGIGPLAAFIAQFVDITEKIAALKTSGDGSNVFIDLGGFNLDGENLQGGPMGDLDTPSSGDLSDLTADPVGTLASLGSIENDQLVPAPLRNVISAFVPPANGAGIDIHFPILEDPAAAGFGLLLGRDASLVTVHADAHFHAKDNASTDGLSFYGLDLKFFGQINFDADLTFGYDTYGLREILAHGTGAILSDLGDGFYMTSGKNGSQINLSGQFGIEAGANAIIAQADVRGAIETGPGGNQPISFSLKDDDKSGKVRFADFLGSFQVTGSLDAGLSLRVAVGVDVPLVGFVGYQHTFGIASVTLLDFSPDSKKPQLALASQPDSSGIVTLYVGATGVKSRVAVTPGGDTVIPNSGNSFGEFYTISDAGPSKLDAPGEESINVTFTVPEPDGSPISVTQRIDRVREIDCDSSDTGNPTYVDQGGPDGADPGPPAFGDQALTIGVMEGVTSAVILHGGSGKANLSYAGSAWANLYAGQGDSVLVGGSGSNYLEGSGGTNTLIGGTSGGTIVLGPGNNNIVVQSGNNQIKVKTDPKLPNPVNRLEVLSQPATLHQKPSILGVLTVVTGVLTLPADPTALVVQVTLSDGVTPLTISEHGITDLIIDGVGGHLPNDIVVSNLSRTGLKSLTANLGLNYYIGIPSSVSIAGSAGPDTFTESTQTDRSTGVTFTDVILGEGTANAPSLTDVKLIGMRLGANDLTLDGKGGTNSYTLYPDSGDHFTTSVQDIGGNPSDKVVIDARSLPPATVDVSDSEATFRYFRSDSSYSAFVMDDFNLNGNVRDLTVYTPARSDAITSSRNIGSTTIESSGPLNTFYVSGFSNYSLIGQGYSDHFFITLPSRFGKSTNTTTTISDLDSSGTGTVEVSDPQNFSASLPTQYIITKGRVVRTTQGNTPGLTFKSVATVTYNAMKSATFDTGLGNNVITVDGTEAAMTFNPMGYGTDQFLIAPLTQNLDLIEGPITINGVANSDNTLSVFDKQKSGTVDQITVGPGRVSHSSVGHQFPIILPESITYSNFASVSITAPGNDLTIATSPIGNVYFATATLESVPGDPARSRIADPEMPPTDFDNNLHSLTLNEGAYGATLAVDQTPQATTTNINLSASGIANINATSGPISIASNISVPGTVNVGQGTLVPIEGDVVIENRNDGAQLTLNVNDSKDGRVHRDITISPNQITGLAGPGNGTKIAYDSSLAGLNINGPLGTGLRADGSPKPPGAGTGSVYNITGTPSARPDPVTTLTSNGFDTVNVVTPITSGYGTLVIKSPKHSTSLFVLATAGPPADGIDTGGGQVGGNRGHTVEVRGKTVAKTRFRPAPAGRRLAVAATPDARKAARVASSSKVHVNIKRDPRTPPPPPVIIDSDRVIGVAPMGVYFTPDQLTALTVGTGNQRIDVLGTPNHGAVGSVVTSLINLFKATITVGDGSGRLTRVQGALDLTKPSGTITSLIVDGSSEPASQVVKLSPGKIRGMAPAKITYLGAKVVHLLGGTGGNTFDVVGTKPDEPVMIDGGSGANRLIGPNLERTWNITGHDTGNVNNVSFKRVGYLTGGNHADTFALKDGADLSGRVDGGPGLNTLDMSAQNRGIVVNLALGTATAIAGRVTNIGSAIGGNVSSILVGDGTTNSLQGGAGRNLLIGRGGAVRVTGGTGDNILIGSVSSFDLEPAALDALMQEFARSDEDFVTRLAHLASGDGSNGDTLLNPTTVATTADKNVLAGGPGNNWFFVTDGNDIIKSGTLRPGNVVTKL